jgi:hypothetical protein
MLTQTSSSSPPARSYICDHKGGLSNANGQLPGRFLAHNQLNKAKRAFLAVDIRRGKTQLSHLTVKQLAALVRVSVPYIVAAQRVAFSRPDLRRSCEVGLTPLHPGRAGRMARAWSKASADERVAFIRLIGCDVAFDVVVAAT